MLEVNPDQREIIRKKYKNYDVVCNLMDYEIMFFNQKEEFHREDGPAYITLSKYMYLKHNKKHNENGPAVVDASGKLLYVLNGKLHNDNGPAIITKNKALWVKNDMPYIPDNVYINNKNKLCKKILFDNKDLYVNIKIKIEFI